MIKIFFILNRKVTPQKNRCVGCWLLALPRAQMTRLSRILGIWFTYYVPVLINFMTPCKHLSITYQGINLRCLLRFFFLEQSSSVKFGTWIFRNSTVSYFFLVFRNVLPNFKNARFFKGAVYRHISLNFLICGSSCGLHYISISISIKMFIKCHW